MSISSDSSNNVELGKDDGEWIVKEEDEAVVECKSVIQQEITESVKEWQEWIYKLFSSWSLIPINKLYTVCLSCLVLQKYLQNQY